MTKSPDRALHKHIRIVPEQWRRIESAAAGSQARPSNTRTTAWVSGTNSFKR